ncbi:MAG TPA: hypothetical protein VFF52_27005 [Isosphaeraceae bacterium]|nr:hypothetical protein [Isosphaeraceae bacterium]
MAEPKYVESLRGEIVLLDRKIDDFHEKFDQKVDTLSENLHKVEIALVKVSTKLEDFIPRIDKFIDRVIDLEKVGTRLEESVKRHDEIIGRISVFEELGTEFKGFRDRVDKFIDRVWGLFVTGFVLLLSSVAILGASMWQIQQHGKQLERLEKSVEKIAGLETSIVRLDATVARLEKSLEKHDQQLERLEKRLPP